MSGPKALSDPMLIHTKPDLIVVSRDNQHRSHRIVVLCLSPYFQRVLRLTPCPQKDNFYRLNMMDVMSPVADQILHYASYGSLDVNDGNVSDLLIVADRYNIRGVMNICQQFLYKNLNAINCFETYLLAHYYNCEDLKRSVANYIRLNKLADHNTNQSNQDLTVEMVHHILDNQGVG